MGNAVTFHDLPHFRTSKWGKVRKVGRRRGKRPIAPHARLHTRGGVRTPPCKGGGSTPVGLVIRARGTVGQLAGAEIAAAKIGSSQSRRKSMNEVPIEHAQLTWSDGPNAFAVVVDARAPADKFRNLENARGACDSGWGELSLSERLLLLMSAAWSALIRDGVPGNVLHDALLAVPEYREWIEQDAPGLDEWRKQA
jgi:hypothetical protein